MGYITVGQYVDSYRELNGAVSLVCPNCGHYTQDVPRACLEPNLQSGRTEWIDCACERGQGRARHGGLPPQGCRCHARYRVRPSGTSGRYEIVAIDYGLMRERALADYAPVLPPATEAVALQGEILAALDEATAAVPTEALEPVQDVSVRDPLPANKRPAAKRTTPTRRSAPAKRPAKKATSARAKVAARK
jgi:hypothetical protein